MKCFNCSRPTNNPRFCSRSCSVSFNNRKVPKRTKKARQCKYCGTTVADTRTTCDRCNPFLVDWTKVTLGEIRERATFQYSARVRQVARNLYRQSNKPKCCLICGYDKHYEVCHKRAIKTFSDKTPIAEVNHLDNLVALCPNHHWEFDNNHLIL
jgi:hypothetical protein